MQQLLIQRMAIGCNLPDFKRAQHGASRLVQMMAIVELALAQMGREFGEGPFQHALTQMVQAEFLKAGRVDDRRRRVGHVQTRKGRGVLAGIERG